MRSSSYRSSGFTLIELMVVVAMVAIMLMLAAPSLREFTANQALGGATSDLMGASMTARSTAINRNAQVVIEPQTGTDWTTGWRVYVDKNGDASYAAADDELIATGPPLPETVEKNATVVTNCASKDKFAYRADGFLLVGGSLGNGGIPLKSKVTGRERCLVFDRTGRTRICGTGTDACS